MTNESTIKDVGTKAGWSALALAAVLLAVEGVIVAESWRGLTGFARLIGITGPWAWGVPLTLDGVSLVAALVALRAELAGESSGLYRLTLFGFTAASAAANWWHGYLQGGAQGAIYLGGMSLAVALVFNLTLRQIRHQERRGAGRVTEQLPRFSGAHWLRFPRLTFAAWSLAIRDGHVTARAALDAALEARPQPPKPEMTPAELASMTKTEATRIALARNSGSVLAAQAWLEERGVVCNRSFMHDVKRGVSGKRRRNRPPQRAIAPATEPDAEPERVAA